jgi:twinkle protein
MLGNKYPAVAVSSASSAKKDCEEYKDYLNSFERIYICFDNDEPGQKATKEVAALFHPSKVYVVNLTKYKDANDYLINNETQEFRNVWFNSQKYRPDEIVSSYSEIDKIIDESKDNQGIPFPFPTLTEMSYGFRFGEVILFTALEGVGKTEILRAIEYNLIKTTEEKIGIIHLEEDEARSIKGLVGYELQKPVHLPDSGIDNDTIKETYRSITQSEDRVYFSSHFGSDDPDIILGTIRFLVAGLGCKVIFLDHISLVVSGLHEEAERKQLDYISTHLKMMAKELEFTLIFISHVNDDGLTRGSRNISKISDLWVHLERDKTEEDQYEKNITKLTINKNRYGGRTGSAGRLYFDPATYVLEEETPASKALTSTKLPF